MRSMPNSHPVFLIRSLDEPCALDHSTSTTRATEPPTASAGTSASPEAVRSVTGDSGGAEPVSVSRPRPGRERRTACMSTDEDPKERLNRELIELLNELRVALPGV